MGIDIRFPNINAQTTEGQVAQMQSYMHQLVEQLNWALNTVTNAQSGNASNIVIEKPREEISPEEAQDTFNSIKALIIKSADIVKAYEETMKTSYNGEYIAVSDFGKYLQNTERLIEDNSKYSLDVFKKVEKITNSEGTGTLDELRDSVRTTEAYIKRGFLGTYKGGEKVGQDAYGIAVGETDELNGTYRSYAWFTSDRLSFFDEAGNETAYISNRRLFITDAVFLGTVQFGKYQLNMDDGLAFTWIGG